MIELNWIKSEAASQLVTQPWAQSAHRPITQSLIRSMTRSPDGSMAQSPNPPNHSMLQYPLMRWVLSIAHPDKIEKLARELRASPLVARLLVLRGLDEPEAAYRFLHPSLR